MLLRSLLHPAGKPGPGSLLLQSIWCSVERYRGASGKEGGLATEALHLCVFTLVARRQLQHGHEEDLVAAPC